MGRHYAMTQKLGRAAMSTITLVVVFFVCLGTGLGVAGGADLRGTGRVFVGEAEQFWLVACVFASAVLALPRATKRAALAPMAAYVISLVLGYLVGYLWGNIIGWNPD